MSSLVDIPELVGFFSYSREDDADLQGELAVLRDRIQHELCLQLGRTAKTFRLWQDKRPLPSGTLWETEIKNSINQAVFFIPIITPAFVASPDCRFELEVLLGREATLGRSDLVFPIVYLDVPGLENSVRWHNDALLSLIAKRQCIDWRECRHLDHDTTEVKRAVERFCQLICDVLSKPWVLPEGRKQQEEAAASVRGEGEQKPRVGQESMALAARRARLRGALDRSNAARGESHFGTEATTRPRAAMPYSGPSYPALALLNNAAQVGRWSEDSVRLEHRGVSRKWLGGFVERLQQDINAPRDEAIKQAKYAQQHNEAGLWGRHDRPDLPIPEIPPYQFIDTHGLVEAIVKPLTAPIAAPLYALVPERFRGRPTDFVSHTWSSFLVGPPRQRIGSLDALNSAGTDDDDEFIWIDFVCYNQHTVEEKAIAEHMLRLIGAIGRVSVCATPTPVYTRSWCLWELLSSQRSGAPIDLRVHPGYRNDKILSVNTLYRSFKGVGKARSSVPGNQKEIYDGCVAFFGSEARADSEIEKLIEERFSGGWHELQSKAESIKFSPSPWIAGYAGFKPQVFEPYFEPGVLDALLFGRTMTVRESFADAGVYLGERETAIDSKQRAIRSWNTSGKDRQEFLRSVQLGDVAAVREHLARGADPDMAVEALTPLTVAAAEGHVAIVDMLLNAGAAIEGATQLSPLRLAADKGQGDVVRLLMRRGASVDAADDDGWTALLWACRGGHLDIAEALLASGADINRTLPDKRAGALHLAAQNGHLAVVRALVARGAAVNAADARNATPLHLAAYQGHAEVVRFLLHHGADPSARIHSGKTALELAESSRHGGVVEILRGWRQSPDKSP